jgi:hypothetical protein
MRAKIVRSCIKPVDIIMAILFSVANIDTEFGAYRQLRKQFMCTFNFMPRLIFRRVNRPWYTLGRKLDEPQIGQNNAEKSLLPLSGFEL